MSLHRSLLRSLLRKVSKLHHGNAQMLLRPPIGSGAQLRKHWGQGRFVRQDFNDILGECFDFTLPETAIQELVEFATPSTLSLDSDEEANIDGLHNLYLIIFFSSMSINTLTHTIETKTP